MIHQLNMKDMACNFLDTKNNLPIDMGCVDKDTALQNIELYHPDNGCSTITRLGITTRPKNLLNRNWWWQGRWVRFLLILWALNSPMSHLATSKTSSVTLFALYKMSTVTSTAKWTTRATRTFLSLEVRTA
ncbi:hypothetical protein ACFX2J_000091 [Malus domestica]